MTGPYPATDTAGAAPLPPLWALRPMRADDLHAIRPWWSDSYHDGDALLREIPFRAFRDRMRGRIDRILARAATECIVACLPEDTSHVIAFVVAERTTLHYVYVREARRGYGVARALTDAWYAGHPAGEASHRTKAGAKIAAAWGLRYNPLAVEGPQ